MTSELSQMLDELMGKNRNAAPDDKSNDMHWSDKDVCKHFLCGFCPAELFTNTRSDLGPCEKIHDEALRKAYQQSSRYMKMSYEADFLHYLQQCMTDVERRIRRNHQRLQLSEEKNQKGPPSKDVEDQINILTQRIEEMLQKIEQLGNEGSVEEAQGVMKLCDQLKEDREQLYGQQKGTVLDAFSVQEKQMEVCEVCGAFLIVGDAQSRVDDHLMGKQHMGYAKIKAHIEELKEKIRAKAEAPPQDSKTSQEDGKSSEKRSDSRSKDEKRRSRSRDGRSDRDRDRNRRRSRDRDSGRHRDDYKRRSRDRDHRRYDDRRDSRYHRNRDRDSRGSRDYHSRSRDDRDRKSSHRSRSRDRDRDRDRDRRHSRKHSRPRSRSKDRKDHKRSRRSDSKDRKHDREREEGDKNKKESKSKIIEETNERIEGEENGTKEKVTQVSERTDAPESTETNQSLTGEKNNEIPSDGADAQSSHPTETTNDNSENQLQNTEGDQ